MFLTPTSKLRKEVAKQWCAIQTIYSKGVYQYKVEEMRQSGSVIIPHIRLHSNRPVDRQDGSMLGSPFSMFPMFSFAPATAGEESEIGEDDDALGS